ncbi:MAG: DUF4956 domain-containing protein [bacterium]|nr:DUF4956 domain-containing protein [bacterium]
MIIEEFLNILNNNNLMLPTNKIITSYTLAFILGVVIYIMYRNVSKGVLYSRGFGITLIVMTLITSLIIMTLSTNIVTSLGAIGALSIIRFRNPIKNITDMMFLYWSIGVGIVIGLSQYNIAIIGSIFITFLLLIFYNVNRNNINKYVVLINLKDDANNKIDQILKKYTKHYKLKTKYYGKEEVEVVYQMKVKGNINFINEIRKLEEVNYITINDNVERI